MSCLFVQTCTHTCVQTRTHTLFHTHTHTCQYMHVCVYTQQKSHRHIHTLICIHARAHNTLDTRSQAATTCCQHTQVGPPRRSPEVRIRTRVGLRHPSPPLQSRRSRKPQPQQPWGRPSRWVVGRRWCWQVEWVLFSFVVCRTRR
jgi:hypothetical protein